MSEDAAYELQLALVPWLKNDPSVSAFIGERVFDFVPRDPATGKVTAQFPFVALGEEQEIPENYDCIEGSEIFLDLHVWSRDPGFREAKRIANAVKASLNDAELPLTDNALVYFVYDGRRVMRDPDGLTSHAVLTFRAGIETP